MFVALITIAVILILYGAVSKPLDARGITSAMIFTAAGLCVGTSALKLVNIRLESLTAERFCELALVFLLFQRLDADRPSGPAPESGLAQPASVHRPAADDPGRPGRRRPGLSRHGAGQRLRSVDDGLLDRRGARAACRLGHLTVLTVSG
jgi:hypothetical protein